MDLERRNARATVIHGASHLPESLIEAMSILAYPTVWWLTMAAFISVFIPAAVVTSLVVLVCMHRFLWSKVLLKGESLRTGLGPKVRLVR